MRRERSALTSGRNSPRLLWAGEDGWTRADVIPPSPFQHPTPCINTIAKHDCITAIGSPRAAALVNFTTTACHTQLSQVQPHFS